MDDEFFASVLKKWADSSQEVVNLRKRLSEVEQERNKYQREVGQLKFQAQNRGLVRRRSPVSAYCGDSEILDLDEVGNKLEKARFEYQRRLKELNDARNSEETLKREVEELKKERAQLQSQVQTKQTQNAQVSSELADLQLEKETMANMISDLRTRLQQTEQVNAELRTKAPSAHDIDVQQVMKLQEQMTSLETQLQELQGLTQNLEAENESLRADLAAGREYLQKAKDSKKGLRTTINQLSRIARNAAGTSEQVSPTQSSSARALAEVPRIPSTETTKATPVTKQGPRVDVDLSFNDITIVAEPSDLNNPLTPISSHRQEALASLPVIIPDIDINDEDNKFTRGFTSAAIGGSIQSLIVRVTSSGTDLAKGRDIEEYLCPRLDHNPWCPSIPGQHGYMFIGLGREKDTYTTPQTRNLFVGLPRRNNKEERYFRYLGVYRVNRVESLSVTEWDTLHNMVKQNYVQATKDKNKDSRTKEAILTAYDSGELSVPCVKLECVDFDEELYAGLLAFRTRHGSARQGRVPKRSRDDDNEGSAHLQQRSKRSASKRVTQQ